MSKKKTKNGAGARPAPRRNDAKACTAASGASAQAKAQGMRQRARSFGMRALPWAGYVAATIAGEWVLFYAVCLVSYKGFFTPYTILAVVILIVAAMLGWYLFKQNRHRTERLFLIAAIPLQVGYIFFMMLFAPSDELAHMNRIFDNRPNELSLSVPAQIPQGNNGWIYHYSQLPPLFAMDFDYSQMGVSGRVTDKYSQLNYLVPSLFAQAGMALGVNAYYLVYAARLWNAFVFLFVAYWVLKRLPAGKKIAIVFMMNPIVLHQMGSASADALTLTAAFGFIAQLLFMRMSDQTTFPAREWVILCVLGVLNVLCKYAYAPLFFGIFMLLPKIRRRWVRWLIPLAALVGCALFVPLLLVHGYSDHLYNMSLTFTPELFLKSLWLTFTQYSGVLLWQFSGGNLGWPEIGGTPGAVTIDVPVAWIIVVVLMVLSFLSSTARPWLKRWERIFCVVVGAVITLIILATFTMGFTNPVVITGVIGRYFIPQAFLTVLALMLPPLLAKEDSPRPLRALATAQATIVRIPEKAFLVAMAAINVYSLCVVVAFFW